MRSSITAVVLALAMSSSAMAQQRPKVLMIVNEKSGNIELMLTQEVGVMKSLLEKAGFDVVVSTASGQPLVATSARLASDVKLSDVRVADYRGLIVPCMANSAAPLPPEGLLLIRAAVASGKPIGAQTGAVVNLARAGVLSGKKYALSKGFTDDSAEMRDALKDAIYSGEGIVQDGTIITSGICPNTAKSRGVPDGTSQLTETLIAELKR
jgi:putative intracellular protease/amidase